MRSPSGRRRILICGDTLYYSSVGNVRVYVTSVDGNRRQVTEDDIYKAENGNVYLTASLSGKEIDPEVDSISLDGIDSVLVCTDGYYNNDEEDDSTWVKIKSDAPPTQRQGCGEDIGYSSKQEIK